MKNNNDIDLYHIIIKISIIVTYIIYKKKFILIIIMIYKIK